MSRNGGAVGGAEQAVRRKRVLYSRMKEARRAAAETTDPAERRRQTERGRILREMYRDACGECARLEGRGRGERRREARGDPIFDRGLVWSDLSGMTWGELDGATWGDILEARRPGAATGRQYRLLTELLNDGVNSCTQRQKQMLHEYYTLGKPMPQIGAELGVDKSTVSRSIKSGLVRVGRHVTARLTIAACIDDQGRFDYLKFCRSAQLLTPRQTEMLYLALTKDASYTMMAAYIGRELSTVSRTVGRMERRLRCVRVELLPELDVSGVRFRDWSGIGEEELARRLGLSRRFFYTALHRGETIGGVPLLHYHALCRMRAGWTAERAADELGVGGRWCRELARRYAGWDGALDMDALPAYTPDPVRHSVERGTVLRALRDLTRGGDGIVDRIDGHTLAKVREAGLC